MSNDEKRVLDEIDGKVDPIQELNKKLDKLIDMAQSFRGTPITIHEINPYTKYTFLYEDGAYVYYKNIEGYGGGKYQKATGVWTSTA